MSYELPTDLPDLTPKQHSFCMGLLQGMTASDAYRNAYDCKGMPDNQVWVRASEVKGSSKVAVWLDAAKQLGMQKGVYALDAYVDDMHRLASRAEKAGNYGAAVNCLTNAAKAAGLMIERSLSATVDANELEGQWQDLLNQRMRQKEPESVTELEPDNIH